MMKNNFKKLFLPIFIILFIASFSIAFAGSKKLGEPCSDDSDCHSNNHDDADEGDAKHLDDLNNQFCTCNDVSDCNIEYGKDADETWTCEDATVESYGLRYCESTKQGKKYPLTEEKFKEIYELYTKTGSTDKEAVAPIKLIPPKVAIPIPGLEKWQEDWQEKEVKPGEPISIPWIAQYIISLYGYGLILASIFAVTAIMVGGIIYLGSGGVSDKINTGKSFIISGLSGLILILGSYLLLKTINPNLITLKALTVDTIVAIDMPEERAVSGSFGKKMLKNFPESPPKFNEPIVPPAEPCPNQNPKRKAMTTQADRDAAFAIQKKYGYPAAVFLAQRILEGKTFGIKCGSFITSKKGDQTAIDKLNCSGKGDFCSHGYTWECTKNSKYLPPAAPGQGSPPDGSDCGKGEKQSQGYTAVHGYACFQKENPKDPFGPLLAFYEKRPCFKGAKDKYGGNPEAFAYAVQACGYATAQGYAGTLVSLMKANCLYTGQQLKQINATNSDAIETKTE